MARTDLSLLTRAQFSELRVETLAAALAKGDAVTNDRGRRAALHILTGFNDMSLLRLRVVRSYVDQGTTDSGPYMRWADLGRDLATLLTPDFNIANHLAKHPADQQLTMLSAIHRTGFDALKIATALGDDSTRIDLRNPAARFGHVNRITIVEALAIAFGIKPGVLHIPGATEPATPEPGA